MRFANIITALSGLAVSGVLSSPVDQANNARIGTATEGNVTATVEMVKTDDGADVARITYTTVDVEHPEKFSAPVTRICWNIFPCIAALAPTVVSCATALASLGLSAGADAACIAAATNTGVNVPKACQGCF